MSLVKKLNVLIASRIGVSEQEVTTQLIESRRTSRKLCHDGTDSSVGGRTTDGLKHLTMEQAASAIKVFHSMTTPQEK